eukprot:4226333-Amphidinium_carterae.1
MGSGTHRATWCASFGSKAPQLTMRCAPKCRTTLWSRTKKSTKLKLLQSLSLMRATRFRN